MRLDEYLEKEIRLTPPLRTNTAGTTTECCGVDDDHSVDLQILPQPLNAAKVSLGMIKNDMRD